MEVNMVVCNAVVGSCVVVGGGVVVGKIVACWTVVLAVVIGIFVVTGLVVVPGAVVFVRTVELGVVVVTVNKRLKQYSNNCFRIDDCIRYATNG